MKNRHFKHANLAVVFVLAGLLVFTVSAEPAGTGPATGQNLSEGEMLQRALDSFKELQELRSRDWSSINWGAVLDKCTEILAFNPEYVDILMNMAEAYRELQSPRKYLLTLLTLQEIMPERVDVYQHLGNAYGQLTQYDKAVEAYTKGIELDPANPWARQCLADFYHFNRRLHTQALPHYKKALELAKPGYNMHYLYIHYACTLRDAGQTQEAKDCFGKAREYALSANDQGALQRITDESRRL